MTNTDEGATMATDEHEHPPVSWDGLRDYPGSRYRIYSSPLGVQHFGFIISRQPPGAQAILHSHDTAEEMYVLLRGEGAIQLGDEVVPAKQFDAFRAPPGLPHANLNPSDEEIYWLVMAAPMGEFTAESDWYDVGSQQSRATERATDGPGPAKPPAAPFAAPPEGARVAPWPHTTEPYGAVSWDGLKTYPGYRYRIYSAPLGVERIVFIISRQPPGASAPLHAHADAEEVYVLLNGEGTLQLGDEVHRARTFDGFRAAPGVLHANANDSEEDIYWLVMAAPGDEHWAHSDWYPPRSQVGRVTPADLEAPDAGSTP
jgi:uncharacterized cupin superfamily protein